MKQRMKYISKLISMKITTNYMRRFVKTKTQQRQQLRGACNKLYFTRL